MIFFQFFLPKILPAPGARQVLFYQKCVKKAAPISARSNESFKTLDYARVAVNVLNSAHLVIASTFDEFFYIKLIRKDK